NYFLIARNGEDYAIDAQGLYFYQPGQPQEQTGALVFTDRSIYRPMQPLYWKVIAYRGRDANFKTDANTGLTVTLYDTNRQEVAKQTVKTNSFGSAAGK